ncbi:MAG: hypothetical protein L6R40_005722 [Gallowayella cf. fulva]|nr:MAG: hypothetical protein L6R40_005722 [Xanthomendoza cf. fulva]
MSASDQGTAPDSEFQLDIEYFLERVKEQMEAYTSFIPRLARLHRTKPSPRPKQRSARLRKELDALRNHWFPLESMSRDGASQSSWKGRWSQSFRIQVLNLSGFNEQGKLAPGAWHNTALAHRREAAGRTFHHRVVQAHGPLLGCVKLAALPPLHQASSLGYKSRLAAQIAPLTTYNILQQASKTSSPQLPFLDPQSQRLRNRNTPRPWQLLEPIPSPSSKRGSKGLMILLKTLLYVATHPGITNDLARHQIRAHSDNGEAIKQAANENPRNWVKVDDLVKRWEESGRQLSITLAAEQRLEEWRSHCPRKAEGRWKVEVMREPRLSGREAHTRAPSRAPIQSFPYKT